MSAKPLAFVIVATSVLLALPASADHGAWWKGTGTATNKDGTAFGLEFYWGGQDAILQCGGMGCQGSGDGRLTLFDTVGTTDAIYPYVGVEDVRDILFSNDPTFCPSQPSWPDPLLVVPDFELIFDGGALDGVSRYCLSNGIAKSDYTGFFLTFDLVIHVEGGFGVAHG